MSCVFFSNLNHSFLTKHFRNYYTESGFIPLQLTYETFFEVSEMLSCKACGTIHFSPPIPYAFLLVSKSWVQHLKSDSVLKEWYGTLRSKVLASQRVKCNIQNGFSCKWALLFFDTISDSLTHSLTHSTKLSSWLLGLYFVKELCLEPNSMKCKVSVWSSELSENMFIP